MKCYFAGSKNPYEYSHVEACFARTSKEAKAFMWKHSHRLSDECDGEYMDLRVARQPAHDKHLDESKTEPYIVSDESALRQMGWSHEGDARCIHCDLATLDDKFPVCEECDACEDCGHGDECTNTEE